MKKLYLLRGLPGSGKSSLAREIGGIILEADQYFIDSKTNEYKFDVSKIKDAHADCQERCRKWMESGYYYDMGKEFGYTIFSLIVENRHGGKNIHGVPDDKLEIMKNRFELKLI
jgi:energy-coupling factor transporter ATP-binding protein EcfA2